MRPGHAGEAPPGADTAVGRAVVVVPIGYRAAPDWAAELVAALQRALRQPVRVAPAPFGPALAFDAERGQYDALRLLERLIALPGSDRVLGIVSVDLFIPMLTHVFGQAQLNGRGAVISTYRLDNAAYGLTPDAAIFAARLQKEAIHEVGHTRGLVHCRDPRCVMHSSTYVEEIDLKGDGFCVDCQRLLRDP